MDARDTRRAVGALIGLLPRASKPWLAVNLAGVLVAAVLPVAFTVWGGVVVSRVEPAVRAGQLDTPAGRALLASVAILALLFIASQAVGPLRQLASVTLGRRVDLLVRSRVMRAVLRPAGIAHLEDPEMLDAVSLARGVGPGEQTPADATRGLIGLVTQILASVASAIVVGRYFVWLAVLMFISHLVARWVFTAELLRILDVMLGQTRATRRAHYFRDMVLEPGAAKEMRVFSLRGWTLDRFGQHWRDGMREVWAMRAQRRWRLVAAVMMIGLVYGVALLVVARAATTTLTAADVTVLVGAILGFSEFNLDFDMMLVNGSGALPAALELERVLPEEQPGPRASQAPVEVATLPRRSIRFEGVRFAYPGGGEVYSGLDLEVPVGRSLAVVGPNGAGKTTLVKLLARLYEPDAGRVVVDGVDLRELDTGAWQRRIAAIFQDFVQYQLPARDNVALGAADREVSDAVLDEAARRAGALPIVESLPRGWDTVLSRQYTDGRDLSGGQWQRIALARAMYAVEAGAGVLVLDEPTANLDVRAEAELFDRFLEITRGLTTILISHRFSTVRRADHIVVLDGGRVTEHGTHDDLLAACGTYATMFKLQAARFVDPVEESER